MKKINTILFDLDGTLLSMDTDAFTKRYFKELAIKLSDYLTPDEVTKNIWNSTMYMINNVDVEKTNEEAFFEDFYKNVKHKKEVLNPILDDFYDKDFDKIKDVSKRNEDIVKAISLLKEKGYDLVVATNPLFPKKAVLDRINWAGLDYNDFIFITNFEEMHYCKPNLDFYREVLKKINKDPSSCLMVGNDIKEDMIAKEIGIRTYLINDFLIGDIEENKNIDYKGDYTDFYKFVKDFPNLNIQLE